MVFHLALLGKDFCMQPFESVIKDPRKLIDSFNKRYELKLEGGDGKLPHLMDHVDFSEFMKVIEDEIALANER